MTHEYKARYLYLWGDGQQLQVTFMRVTIGRFLRSVPIQNIYLNTTVVVQASNLYMGRLHSGDCKEKLLRRW